MHESCRFLGDTNWVYLQHISCSTSMIVLSASHNFDDVGVKIDARTLVLGADSREIGGPQYVVVVRIPRVVSEFEAQEGTCEA